MLWALVAIVLAPALFWGAYARYKDRYQPEPLIVLGVCYLLGMGSAFLAVGLYRLVDPIWGMGEGLPALLSERGAFLWYAICVIGPVEEAAKLAPFLLLCVRLKAFDEEIDGIIYASLIGLGFATCENLRGLGLMEGFPMVARAIALPLVHGLFGSIWGWAFAWAMMRGRRRLAWTGLAFLVSVLLHGLYDFLATDPERSYLSAGLVLIVWTAELVLLERLAREARRKRLEASPPGSGERL